MKKCIHCNIRCSFFFLSFQQQRHDMDQGLDFVSTLPPLRRAKSLDRRTTESVMTVNFSYVLYSCSRLP